MAAVALAGAAVYTVAQASCTDPGRYVRHDDGTVELVGSCVDPAHLPKKHKYDHDRDQEPVEPAVNDLVKAP
ncbi:hypothetical protein [Actinophytocola gossypii]|uniref:hypothetical protein n=1 Tax=Actinophytocola gossypii TaxID=2812003 RepID=UPI0035CCD59D